MQAFHHHEKGQLVVGHCPGEKEHGFHVKNQEDQRKNIILSPKLDPTISNRLDAAFVSRIF